MDVQSLINQAEEHVEAGRLEEAHRLYSSLLQAFPRDVALPLAMAKVYTLLGRTKAAKQLLLRAITLDPINIRVLGALAQHFLRVDRNFAAAREMLVQLLSLDTSLASAWLDLGHIHAAEGSEVEARNCYGKALDLDIHSSVALSPVYYPPSSARELTTKLARELDRFPQPKAIGLELLWALNGVETDVIPEKLLEVLVEGGVKAEEFLTALVEASLALGRAKVASVCGERLAALRPDDASKQGLWADVLLRQNRFEEARTAWDRVLILDPARSDALVNRWVAEIGCATAGDSDLESRLLASICKDHPEPKQAFATLASAARSLHWSALAESLLKTILEDHPDDLDMQEQLAGHYYAERRYADAIEAYEAILEKDPSRPDVYANLLSLAGMAHCPDKAAVWVDQVIALDEPGGAVLSAYSVAKSLCLWDEAATLRVRIMEAFNSGKITGTALMGVCFNMLGDAAVDNDTLFAMHMSVAEGFRSQLKSPPYTRHPALQRTSGKMRIGYVSGDFVTHVVNGFFSGLINHCDRSRFEVYCYSTRPEETEDHVSKQYRQAVDRFINVAEMDDKVLAKRIHDDGIHVLVDLAGYTAYNRLAAFTYTPAPVQMTYLGYSYSTGVAEVDYIIADPFLDGPRTAHFCAEKPLRLAECFMNFGEVKPYPLSADIPFDRNGYITFGTMNKSQKMNPEVIRLWSRVLAAVPGSRMRMKRFDYALERTRERIWQEFEKHGIERDRVRIIWRDETPNYLDFYTTLDMALDPFPFTGATTTMETLRMGVPLVTLVGDAIAQRNSYAVMNNAGLDLSELYAFTEDEFVEKAVALASDPDRIRQLHRSMPVAIHSSSLVRPERFAAQMEAAFIEGWDRKYPDRPWGGLADGGQQEYVTLIENTRVAVPSSHSDLFAYVLKEQGRWFEPEWMFGVGLAPALENVWEVSADPGVYALPMARQGTKQVRVWGVSKMPASLLRAGVAENGLVNLTVEDADRLALDLPWQESPDWLRLGAEAGLPAKSFVQANRDALAAADPILLLPIGPRDWPEVVRELGGLGYAPYVFLTGLGALVPFAAERWDTFIRNLVFLKPGRASALAAQGLVVHETVGLESEPAATDTYWQGLLGGLPYAEVALVAWQRIEIDAGNSDYFLALNLYALSRFEAAPLALRLACLERAVDHSLTALVSSHSVPRLLTAARILAEAGRRSKAVQCLNQLITQVTGEEMAAELDEPFLALEPAWESADPAQDSSGWLFAMVLATGDKWRGHSTRFTGLSSLPVLDRVIATGWVTPEVMKRAELIRQRFHLETEPVGEALPL